jgi:hypothetical protein
MPEHKSNIDAVLHHMMPTPLPAGCVAIGLLTVKVLPAAGVLLYPAQLMRKTEAGAFEIQRPPSEVWEPAPEGVRVVHPIGQPLPPELCDIVLMAGTMVKDTLSPNLLAGPGQKPTAKTSTLMHGEMSRMPLTVWQEGHMRQLRGQVT